MPTVYRIADVYIIGSDAPTFTFTVSDDSTSEAAEDEVEEDEEGILRGARGESEEYFASEMWRSSKT